jgi:hypothetical protein
VRDGLAEARGAAGELAVGGHGVTLLVHVRLRLGR